MVVSPSHSDSRTSLDLRVPLCQLRQPKATSTLTEWKFPPPNRNWLCTPLLQGPPPLPTWPPSQYIIHVPNGYHNFDLSWENLPQLPTANLHACYETQVKLLEYKMWVITFLAMHQIKKQILTEFEYLVRQFDDSIDASGCSEKIRKAVLRQRGPAGPRWPQAQ